jgi:hypothetical protein
MLGDVNASAAGDNKLGARDTSDSAGDKPRDTVGNRNTDTGSIRNNIPGNTLARRTRYQSTRPLQISALKQSPIPPPLMQLKETFSPSSPP